MSKAISFFINLNLRVINQSNEVKKTQKQKVNAEVWKWAMSYLLLKLMPILAIYKNAVHREHSVGPRVCAQ